jgi:hypothetical protein
VIPFVAVLSVPAQRSRTFSLRIPLFLLWIVVVPLGLLVSPFILIACLVCRVNPFRLLAALWQILCALKHTEVEFEGRSAAISVCIL